MEASRMFDTPDIHARIAQARNFAGYTQATAAARAFGWTVSTYLGYENGDRKPGLDAACGIAQAYGVSLDWLVLNKGTMTGGGEVEIRGAVGAGAIVDFKADEEEIARGAAIALPRNLDAQAYVVRGDSMRPRFFPNEVLIFEKRPSDEEALVGQYCMVQLKSETGPYLIKILRRGRGAMRWRLESHNADPIEDVELLFAWRWIGLLPPRASATPTPDARARANPRVG